MTYPAHSHPLADDEALRRRLVALARHWLAHGEQAEDLVQDTWLRTADGALPLAAGSREAWLVTVLRNLCIDAWRRQGRHQVVLGQLSENDASVSGGESPEQLAEQAQRVEQAVRRLVATLSAGDVAAVLLYEVFDFSHAELGELTGRSEAASRQRLHRMLQRLRRIDTEDRPVDDDSSYLLALCQWALAQRDPSGLVAVLRVSRPQAMALSAHVRRHDAGELAKPPAARLVQIGNLLALQTRTAGGFASWLPLGEAVAEPV